MSMFSEHVSRVLNLSTMNKSFKYKCSLFVTVSLCLEGVLRTGFRRISCEISSSDLPLETSESSV